MSPRTVRLIVLAFVLAAVFAISRSRQIAAPAQDAAGGDVAWLTTDETRNLNLPFSEAVRVGTLLYLSGQIGVRPGTLELVPGGMEAEARQTMENIRATLERYGSSMDRVVRCIVMLADMQDWPAFNQVYRTFFTTNLPARSALGANGLALGARVEVECTATVAS